MIWAWTPCCGTPHFTFAKDAFESHYQLLITNFPSLIRSSRVKMYWIWFPFFHLYNCVLLCTIQHPHKKKGENVLVFSMDNFARHCNVNILPDKIWLLQKCFVTTITTLSSVWSSFTNEPLKEEVPSAQCTFNLALFIVGPSENTKALNGGRKRKSHMSERQTL